MITLHLLQLLANEGFGIVDTNMFFEEAPLDSKGDPKEGVWIVTRGAPVSRFSVERQSFDIYSRYSNKLTGYRKLEDILNFLQEAYGEVCELPEVPTYSTTNYENVRIRPTSGVETVGTDENEKLVRVISGEIQYERN